MEIDPQKFFPLIFDKKFKGNSREKRQSLNKWCCNNWTAICQNMNLNLNDASYTKINSKLITDLNVKFKIIKFLEEKIGENPSDLALGKELLDMTPKAQSTEEKIDKLDFIKI